MYFCFCIFISDIHHLYVFTNRWMDEMECCHCCCYLYVDGVYRYVLHNNIYNCSVARFIFFTVDPYGFRFIFPWTLLEALLAFQILLDLNAGMLILLNLYVV